MNHDRYDDEYIAAILRECRTVAIVGASANPGRPSNAVMQYLLSHGYAAHPINPGQAEGEIHGQKVYARLLDVPAPVELVDIFRNSDAALEVTRATIRLKDNLGIKAVWMQIGVRNDEAATEAEAAGLKVVMDRCPKIEHARLSHLI